jgi:hypothetical protein
MTKDKDTLVKKQVSCYKYSKKGEGSVNEAIILQGQPCL